MLGRFRREVRFRLLRRRARRAIRRLDPAADSILVTGLTRSGSTWLQEVIGQWPGTVCLFEPIHRRVAATRPALTLRDGHPEDDAASPTEAAVVSAVLRGELLDPWSLQNLTPAAVPARARRLCVKLINCNNGLPRLASTLPLGHVPLVLVRHPCAHVASWTRLKWENRFGELERRFPRVLAAEPWMRPVVAGLSDPLDRMAAAWCLGNRLPLTLKPQGRWKLVRYESLQAEPEQTLADIFRSWNEPAVPREVLNALDRPSRTTWRPGSRGAAEPWRTQLTGAQRRRVYEICSRLGVDAGDDHYRPLHSAS